MVYDKVAKGLVPAITTVSVITRLMSSGHWQAAAATLKVALQEADLHPLLELILGRATFGLLNGNGGSKYSRVMPTIPNGRWIPSWVEYAKEFHMLREVLILEVAGSTSSICSRMEGFAKHGLKRARMWFKVAGGAKSDVIAASLRGAGLAPCVLEVGTYCGYSALRISAAVPGVRVITIEVDPLHVQIARTLVAFAGLSHVVEIWTGHSTFVLPRLYGSQCFPLPGEPLAAIYFDYRGSLYSDDLETLRRGGWLRPQTVLVADNVLKPGAPLFLWNLCCASRPCSASSGKLSGCHTQIVDVPEFAMPAEDWISVSVGVEALGPLCTCSEGEGEDEEQAQVGEPPEIIWTLQELTDNIRVDARPTRGSVDFDSWAAYASDLRLRFACLGICPTAHVVVDGCDS